MNETFHAITAWIQPAMLVAIGATWARMEATQREQKAAIEALRKKVDAAIGNGTPGHVVTKTECALISHSVTNVLHDLKERVRAIEKEISRP